MPGCHKTVNCPHCGLLQRNDNLKRHIQNNHNEVPQVPQITSLPSVTTQNQEQSYCHQEKCQYEYLNDKYDNGEPMWMEIALPDGNKYFVKSNIEEVPHGYSANIKMDIEEEDIPNNKPVTKSVQIQTDPQMDPQEEQSHKREFDFLYETYEDGAKKWLLTNTGNGYIIFASN